MYEYNRRRRFFTSRLLWWFGCFFSLLSFWIGASECASARALVCVCVSVHMQHTVNVLSVCLSLMASTTLRLWRLLPNLDDFMRTHFFLVCGVIICVILMLLALSNFFFARSLLLVSLHYVIMIMDTPTIHVEKKRQQQRNNTYQSLMILAFQW